LHKEFPELFIKNFGRSDAYFYSVNVGDGWFDIIYKACRLIKFHLNNKAHDGKILIIDEDFYDILYDSKEEDIEEMMSDLFYIIPSFSEIKEKYGELRIYLNGTRDDYINAVIDFASSMSVVICEHCGSYSSNNQNGKTAKNNKECSCIDDVGRLNED